MDKDNEPLENTLSHGSILYFPDRGPSLPKIMHEYIVLWQQLPSLREKRAA